MNEKQILLDFYANTDIAINAIACNYHFVVRENLNVNKRINSKKIQRELYYIELFRIDFDYFISCLEMNQNSQKRFELFFRKASIKITSLPVSYYKLQNWKMNENDIILLKNHLKILYNQLFTYSKFCFMKHYKYMSPVGGNGKLIPVYVKAENKEQALSLLLKSYSPNLKISDIQEATKQEIQEKDKRSKDIQDYHED